MGCLFEQATWEASGGVQGTAPSCPLSMEARLSSGCPTVPLTCNATKCTARAGESGFACEHMQCAREQSAATAPLAEECSLSLDGEVSLLCSGDGGRADECKLSLRRAGAESALSIDALCNSSRCALADEAPLRPSPNPSPNTNPNPYPYPYPNPNPNGQLAGAAAPELVRVKP